MKKKSKRILIVTSSLLFTMIIGRSIMIKNNTNTFNINDKFKKEVGVNKQSEQRAKEDSKEKTENKQNNKETTKDKYKNNEIKEKEYKNNNNNNKNKNKEHKENKSVDKENKNTHNDTKKIHNKEKIDLNNIENVNSFAKNAYKEYFSMDLNKDKDFKFNIVEKTVEKTSEKLWFCSWMGKYEGTDTYLNILINKEDGCIKKIDKYDYSNEEQDKTIMDDEAKKIALDFVNKVHKDKVGSIGDTKIIKNSKDGYKIILPKKNSMDKGNGEIMIVAVNPYSGAVNSFTNLWN